MALWAWNVDDDRFTMDERGFELWGLPWRETVTFEELSAHIHPADRDRVRAAFAATRAVLGPYEADFRICVGDEGPRDCRSWPRRGCRNRRPNNVWSFP